MVPGYHVPAGRQRDHPHRARGCGSRRGCLLAALQATGSRPRPSLVLVAYAVGAAVQFRMLAASGRDTSSTVGGLAAFSLLGVGGLLALPAFTLPVILLGAPTSRGLVNAAVLGAVAFVAFVALGAVVLAYDAPLRWVGQWVHRLRNWVLRKRPSLEGLDQTLLAQRNDIRAVLGRQWCLLLAAAPCRARRLRPVLAPVPGPARIPASQRSGGETLARTPLS